MKGNWKLFIYVFFFWKNIYFRKLWIFFEKNIFWKKIFFFIFFRFWLIWTFFEKIIFSNKKVDFFSRKLGLRAKRARRAQRANSSFVSCDHVTWLVYVGRCTFLKIVLSWTTEFETHIHQQLIGRLRYLASFIRYLSGVDFFVGARTRADLSAEHMWVRSILGTAWSYMWVCRTYLFQFPFCRGVGSSCLLCFRFYQTEPKVLSHRVEFHFYMWLHHGNKKK